MLYIQTPLYRYENLEKVYESIPKHEDIRWFISKISERPTPESYIWKDERVTLFDVDCIDSDTISKRNTCFNEINRNSWFCLLDDDNTFHNGMYELYQEYKDSEFIGMIVGIQNGSANNFRLAPIYPKWGKIDTGNVLCHSSILDKAKWKKRSNVPKDFLFWRDCFKVFGTKNTILLNKVISNYNVLRPEI
jgi:hypothetical protein